MARQVTLSLPDHVAHRLEVAAAKENMRLEQELEYWLTELVDDYEARKPQLQQSCGNGHGTPKPHRTLSI